MSGFFAGISYFKQYTIVDDLLSIINNCWSNCIEELLIIV